MLRTVLKKGHDKRLLKGHQWVFSNELSNLPKADPGSLVEVFDITGNAFGIGFYNPNSLIAVRLLFTEDEVNKDFFLDRIIRAYELRKIIYPGEKMYRLVFGESDFLPGLVIDKYEDYFAVQMLSAGMEFRKTEIIESLLDLFPGTKGIIGKNMSKLRQNEGLPLEEEIYFGDIPDEFITTDNDIKVNISLKGSQKTGYYLDQRENRNFIRRISSGLKVLDCFCNQGAFALNAAYGGAREVLGIDSSAPALESARNNAALNNLNNLAYMESDVADYLESQAGQNNMWDLVVLDPPAFAKNKKSVPKALVGYSKINRLGLRLTESGGFLATSSCSQHIEEKDFYYIIYKEAAKLNRQVRLIFRGMQSPDHPVLASMPETQYLKFFVFEVV